MAHNDKQTVYSVLVSAIRSASIFNAEIQVAPACVLWPDRDRQWEAIIPLLQSGFLDVPLPLPLSVEYADAKCSNKTKSRHMLRLLPF
jgi:hypothetical protein